jgi:superfamily II DNA or RNA helicase
VSWLESLQRGVSLSGLVPNVVVTIAAVVPIGPGAVQVFYKLPDGSTLDALLNEADAQRVHVAVAERPWSFDGDPDRFKLVVEARRFALAHLLDPMHAIHTSNVQPLPHQITAVYEHLLPRQPLRFLLADDPGAGKTIMAGLYIRELVIRADAQRVLVVAPGSLVEQWRDELRDKFGLGFMVYHRELDGASISGDPFEDHPHLIARLDQLSRDEALAERVSRAGWDLVIFDEAHKLSAHLAGEEIKTTGRFRLAKQLSEHTRHLLLMTATPHNGIEADFQLFLSLLDPDRFYGKPDANIKRADVSDLLRRMVKEELIKFDGTPLFPERRAYTVNYHLSELERELYEEVTNYVKLQMNQADNLPGRRRASVGFALTTLQRRLASSPEAIFQSIKRRRERLEARLSEAKSAGRGRRPLAETLWDERVQCENDLDDLDSAEQEAIEEQLVDDASASTDTTQLEAEILVLKALEIRARSVVESRKDRKWEELSNILQHDERLQDADGRLRKIIIFTEHRDTLNYLHGRITQVLGDDEAVVCIHGSTPRDKRREAQASFRDDPKVRVLLATDAAGEGVNLQRANLMVNYDLPWNPNRLEQRFGRIHRIGQESVCHLWSLVAADTREGEVFNRLLDKLRVEGAALKGRVFDILGEVFEGSSLRDLLIDAIRHNDDPETLERMKRTLDHAFDPVHIQTLLNREALAQEVMSPARLFEVKEQMELAEARRLQPHYVRSFFLHAFHEQGGRLNPREADRFEITHVPEEIRRRRGEGLVRSRRDLSPVSRRYSRVCFEKAAIRPAGRADAEEATLLHPGHPLVEALIESVLERDQNLLRRGATFVDSGEEAGDEPWLLFMFTHELRTGDDVLSKRLSFVKVTRSGEVSRAGWAPHLDLSPFPDADRPLLTTLLGEPWLSDNPENKALALAASTLAPEHQAEVEPAHTTRIERTLHAVHDRLTREIGGVTARWKRLKTDAATGKDVALALVKATDDVKALQARLERRKRELEAQSVVRSMTPVVLGGALVIPARALAALRGEPVPITWSADAVARARIERLAMEAVTRDAEARLCVVKDVSAQKCGWDLTVIPPTEEGRQPESLHVEVKGRAKGSDTVTITANEVRQGLNQGEKFFLALVFVGEDSTTDGPHYIRAPFDRPLAWDDISTNKSVRDLLSRAKRSLL